MTFCGLIHTALPRTTIHTSLAHPRIWGSALVLIAAMFLFGWQLNSASPNPSWTIVYLLGGFLVMVLFTSFSQRVTLDDRGIHYRSFLIKSTILWEDVAGWGVFRSKRYGVVSVKSKDIKRSPHKYALYVSTEAKVDRRSVSIVTPTLVNVGFRPWIAEELEKRLGEDTLL